MRYAAAPLAVAFALGCRLALNPLLRDASPFMFFFVAILISAWLGGFGPGLAATALSVLVADYFYLEPRYTVLGGGLEEYIQIVAFLILGAVISVIVARMRREQKKAEHAAEAALTSESEARRAESALRESEARFRGTFDNSAIGITHIDLNGNWLRVNQRFCDLLGYARDDLEGKKFWDLTHPDDIALDVAPYTQLIRGSIDHYDLEQRYIARDGRAIWVYVSRALQRDREGNPCYSITNVVDISDRKMAEQRLIEQKLFLESVLDALTHPFYVINANDYTIKLANSASGMKDGGLHTTCHALTHGSDIPCHILGHPCPVEQVKATGKACTVEHIHKDRQGNPCFYEVHAHPVFNSSGAVTQIIEYNLDITERKQNEQALNKANERLLDADRRKDEFLAMLAHELRNPLAPIRYAAQMLHMPGLTPEQIHKQHGVIDRQVSHMGRLLDDLLEVSRITRGKIQLKREIVDLRSIARHALESLRPMIEGRGQLLTYDGPSSPLPVDGDPTRLEQIIRNLLHNANKFTEAGGCIQLSLGLESATEWQAVLRVRDSGIGIAPEMLPRVFDLFAQAEQALDRTQGGLGIGLAMVSSLVQMHGGSAEALSAGPGLGSEFVVRLPLVAEEIGGIVAAPGSRVLSLEVWSKPRRVLVVDDNEDSVASLGELLSLWGHEVQTAHDGSQALVAARNWQPEVVLLDIGLPGMDGYEVARHLREAPATSGAFLVALTGYGKEEDRQRALRAGFDRHLVKPVELERLQAMLLELHAA